MARGGVNNPAACTGERVVVQSLSDLENYTSRGDWPNTIEVRSVTIAWDGISNGQLAELLGGVALAGAGGYIVVKNQ